MLVVVAALICLGAIGGGLFAAGIVLPLPALVAVGITLLVISVVGMLLNYVLSPRPTVVHNPIPVSYSTNNMNSMKRNRIVEHNTSTISADSTYWNKSDTDLELINRQEEGNLI